MKIDLTEPMVNIKGASLEVDGEVLTVGVALANIVVSQHKTKGGFRPLKSWELAQKFYKDKTIELDNADVAQLKDVIEDVQGYSDVVKGQLLEKLAEK